MEKRILGELAEKYAKKQLDDLETSLDSLNLLPEDIMESEVVERRNRYAKEILKQLVGIVPEVQKINKEGTVEERKALYFEVVSMLADRFPILAHVALRELAKEASDEGDEGKSAAPVAKPEPEKVSKKEEAVVDVKYEALTKEEVASLPEKVRDELKTFLELQKLIDEFEKEKDKDFKDAILELISNLIKQIPNEKPFNFVLRLKISAGGLGIVDQKTLVGFINGVVEKSTNLLGKSSKLPKVALAEASVSGALSYIDPEKLTSKEMIKMGVGEDLLKLFLDYMGTITREGKFKAAALTNVDYNSLDKDQKSTYDAFSDYWKKVITRKTELLSGSLSDRDRNELILWYSRIDDLIQNSANSWEYAFANMKNNFGLAHNVETVKIKVNPERWRRIFLDEPDSTGHNGYALVGNPSRIEELGIESEKTHRETVGPFWDMWDIAIQVAISPEPGTNDGNFKYGDDMANRMGKFYDYVIDKYFWEDPGTNTVETARGKAYKEYFRKTHGPVAGDKVGGKTVESPLWNAVILQTRLMFDIGNLLDDIHATQAIRGGSNSHELTKISVNGESKALWQVVYPIHAAGYQIENEQSPVSHASMNIAVATNDSLVNEFSKAGRQVQRGSLEMVKHTRMFVDTLIDVNEGNINRVDGKPYNPPVLGFFDETRGFPNFARSILEFGLSQADRYFLVDLQGWDYMWTELFKPLSSLTQKEAEQKMGAWAKAGIGRMKLVNGAISIENYVALTKLYYARVFAAYVGNKEIPLGRKIIAENGISMFGNVSNDVQNLRFSVVRSIQERGSTINYIKPGTPMGTTRLKRALMNLLGAEFTQSEADFIASFETYKKKQDELARKKREKKEKEAELSKVVDLSRISVLNSEIEKLNKEIKSFEDYFKEIDPKDGHSLPKGLETSSDRISGIAPAYLIRTFRRGPINDYAHELSEHEKYPAGFLPAYHRLKNKMKGVFGEDALIEEIEPPYLQIQKDKEEKAH